MASSKKRLDALVFESGLAESGEGARRLIIAGLVKVDGQVRDKPGEKISPDAKVEVTGPALKYVSRGGLKLEKALDRFGIDLAGVKAMDIGASTGGFTDCMLQRGASKVYAVDVGHDQLAGSVRDDPRVVVRERLNLRDLTLEHLDDGPVDVVVADVSFISLKLLMPALLGVLRPDGVALLMVKPQFEVGRAGLDDHGIVVDPALQVAAVDGVVASAEALGFTCDWRGESPLPGTTGNREFFVRLRRR